MFFLALQEEFLMVQAQVGDLVRVHYTGRLAAESIFDTSMQREPLEFTLGEGDLIPGFEQAVLGMTAGKSRTATLLADQAYGPHRAERVMDVECHHCQSSVGWTRSHLRYHAC
jgi:peptidylprolyl isomerase